MTQAVTSPSGLLPARRGASALLFLLAMLMLLAAAPARAQGDYESYKRDAQNQLRSGGWYLYMGDMTFDEISFRDVANSTFAAGGYDATTWLTSFNRNAIDSLMSDVRRRRPDVARFLDTHRRDIFTTLATAVRAKTYTAYTNDFIGCGVITLYSGQRHGGGYGGGYGSGSYGNGGHGGGYGPSNVRYQVYMRVKLPYNEVGPGPGPGPNPYPNPRPPSGGPSFFNWQGTGYFTPDGRTYFAFASPKHLEFFRSVVKGNEAGTMDKHFFGVYGGLANLPEGYFSWGGTLWYTDGHGNLVAFSSVPSALAHQAARPNAARWGQFDVDPRKIMRQTGTL